MIVTVMVTVTIMKNMSGTVTVSDGDCDKGDNGDSESNIDSKSDIGTDSDGDRGNKMIKTLSSLFHFSYGISPFLSSAPCNKPCPKNYKPVCDTKGKTHANKCKFEIAQCKAAKKGITIKIAYDGKCKRKHIRSSNGRHIRPSKCKHNMSNQGNFQGSFESTLSKKTFFEKNYHHIHFLSPLLVL